MGRVVSAPVAAGIKRPGKRETNRIHAVELQDGSDIAIKRVLCNRVKVEHILEDGALYNTEPVDCPQCASVIRRMQKEAKRKENPRGVHARRVGRLYESFREAPPRRFIRGTLPKNPRALMSMGYTRRVDYDTTVRGRSQGYTHSFAPGAQPLLCTDGKRLFLIGGRYKVTGRGIVDLDGDGIEQD